ncbi:MAG: AIR synthase-related protein, partial [Candidatus Omnitrophota bacterium]|nr:AIR synthase-related protein [Candidatus Omnitrophota bacterium]
PVLNSKKGIVLSCGINPDYGKIDPYWMAASVIDEALRQVVSVGGDINKAALLDNFCWGNTDKPDRLGGLVRAAQACYDIAKEYGIPFISGKDSLNNEYSTGKKTISIPPTLLISCVAVMDDITKAITMDTKRAGNAIYLIGLTFDELGGSQYYKMNGFIGNNIPKVNARYGKRLMNTLSAAIKSGYVKSCHDCSDGGVGVTLAEMAFAGGLGMRIDLGGYVKPREQRDLAPSALLFSESNTRFAAEIENEKKFLKAMRGLPLWKLGHTTGNKDFKIIGVTGKTLVETDIYKLKAAWQNPFKAL